MRQVNKKFIVTMLAIAMILLSPLSTCSASAACAHTATYPSYNGVVQVTTSTSYHSEYILVTNPFGQQEWKAIPCTITTTTSLHQFRNICTSCGSTIFTSEFESTSSSHNY